MLKEKIQTDTKESMKAGNSFVTGVLRMALASIQAKEKEKLYKNNQNELTDEEITATLASEIKKRRDAIVLYEKGGRPELAENERKEIEVLQKYLPEQLSEDEIRKLVKESIISTGAKEPKDMGKVMAELNPKVKGRSEGGIVSRIVKEELSK